MDVGADTGFIPLTAPMDGPAERTPDKNRLFLRLFLQNQRGLYAYVLTLLPHRADADDVLQETSLVMWDKFDADGPPTDFLAWGRRIAYHKVLDFYKKAQRAQARLSRVFVEPRRVRGATDALRARGAPRGLAACLGSRGERDLLNRRFADAPPPPLPPLKPAARWMRSTALAKPPILFECVEKSLARRAAQTTKSPSFSNSSRSSMACARSRSSPNNFSGWRTRLNHPEAEAYYVRFMSFTRT